MQRTRNLKHLILLSKNLSRDRPPRKNLRQTDLDGIQSQQNSRDEMKGFNPVFLLFARAMGRRLCVFLASQIHMHLKTAL